MLYFWHFWGYGNALIFNAFTVDFYDLNMLKWGVLCSCADGGARSKEMAGNYNSDVFCPPLYYPAHWKNLTKSMYKYSYT